MAITYALVGSFASGAWGESRFTQDIDIVIEMTSTKVPMLCESFPSDEFYVSIDAARVAGARSGQFKLIHPASGNKHDFMISGRSTWAVSELHRCRRVQLAAELDGSVAVPDEVILSKLVYFKEGKSDNIYDTLPVS